MSLDPRRFVANEYVNTDWTLTVEAGTSLEDIANPAFFANVSSKMQPYDHIRVRGDTGEFYAELMVTECARNWAKTIVLFKVQLNAAVEEVSDTQYEVKMLGPHKKWCVIRKSDKEAIKEECSSKQDANTWLQQYLITL